MRDDGSYTEDELHTILGVGTAEIPSFLAERYRPQAPGTSRRAWTFGVLGLFVPVLSLVGAFSGWRAARRGNRLGWAAASWCVLTGVLSVLWWANALDDDPPSSSSSVEIELELRAEQVGIVDEPPEGVVGLSASDEV